MALFVSAVLVVKTFYLLPLKKSWRNHEEITKKYSVFEEAKSPHLHQSKNNNNQCYCCSDYFINLWTQNVCTIFYLCVVRLSCLSVLCICNIFNWKSIFFPSFCAKFVDLVSIELSSLSAFVLVTFLFWKGHVL